MYPKKPRKARVQVFRESLEPPKWAADFLTQAGGLNRFGEPLFRLVWSNSRLGFVGGRFEDRDEHGYLIREVLALRTMPKYLNPDRWIVEQWLAPERYGSPEAWYKQTKEWGEEGNIAQMGPYPSRGDYELLSVLETPQREFVQVERWILEGALWALRRAKQVSYAEGVRRRKEAAAKKRQADLAYSREMLNEATMPVANDGMMVTVL